MNQSKRSFGEMVILFIALDFLLLGVFFVFVPIYPWWLFFALAFVFKYIVPGLLGNKR